MREIDIKELVKPEKTKDKNTGKGIGIRIQDALNRDIRLPFSKSIDDKFKENFYSQISLLLSEGIDLKTSLTIVIEEIEKVAISTQFIEISQQITNGEKLATAMEKNKNFTPYEYVSISIGEESGKTIEIMKELSLFFQRKVKLQRQLLSALIYPTLVLLVSLGAVAFMLNFVVPMFTEVFKRFKGHLPYLTEIIINLSASFKSYFWPVSALSAIVLISLYTQRNKIWFRRRSSLIILQIPVLGEMLRKIYLTRFCQSLALLLQSKVSIIKALDLVKDMIEFYPLEAIIEPIKLNIIQGQSLYLTLSKYSIFPKRMVTMIKIAEDVNKLDEMLSKLSLQLSEETEHQIELFNKLLEPILIIILGVIVGTILVAMYLPLFQLGSQFNI